MKESEQIEIWRSEFESWFDLHTNKNHGVSYYVGANNKYCFTDIELAWQAFLIAKQNQPVIRLPEKCIVVENDPSHWINAKRGFDVCLDEVKKSIIAAGYKFTIGE